MVGLVAACDGRVPRAMWLVGALAAVTTPTISAGDQEVWRTAVDAHATTFQSIQTLECKLAINDSLTTTPHSQPANYWLSRGRVRTRSYQAGAAPLDMLCLDGRLTHLAVVTPGQKGRTQAELRVYRDLPIGDSDALFYGQLLFPRGDPTVIRPLAEWIGEPYTVDEAKQVEAAGRPLVYAKVQTAQSSLEFWFDPAVNHLVRKHIITPVKDEYGNVSRTVAEVESFREAAPTLFFPERVTLRMDTNGKQFGTRSITFSDIKINKPIAESLFALTIPPGTRVRDEFSHTVYTTGSDGKPVGRVEKLYTPDEVERAQRSAPAKPVTPRKQTLADPTPWSWWLLPVSLSLLVVAAGIVVWRAVAGRREASRG